MAKFSYREAAAARELGLSLIASEDEFEHLRDRDVLFFFVTPTPKKDGKEKLGTAEVVRGKNSALYWEAIGEADTDKSFFRIVISKDAWDYMEEPGREFVMRHELRHCIMKWSRQDKEFNMAIKPHDVELFMADLENPVFKTVCEIWELVKRKSSGQLAMEAGESR